MAVSSLGLVFGRPTWANYMVPQHKSVLFQKLSIFWEQNSLRGFLFTAFYLKTFTYIVKFKHKYESLINCVQRQFCERLKRIICSNLIVEKINALFSRTSFGKAQYCRSIKLYSLKKQNMVSTCNIIKGETLAFVYTIAVPTHTV